MNPRVPVLPSPRITVAALALLAAGGSAHASNWTEFRGPGGAGTLPNAVLPAQLDPKSSIRWETPLPGRGLSAPVLVGDRVLLTASSGPRQDRLHVLCLRASDGVLLWERQFFATGRTMCHEKTSVAANTPVSDGARVFALFSSCDVVALDLDGNLLWVRALALDYPNVSNSLGMASSLAFADDTVIAQVENDAQPLALGLDAATGINRWKLERPKMANWTSPIAFRDPASGRQLVALQSGKGLLAVEPATGREVWNYAEGASTVTSSATADGLIFVPSFGITAIKPPAPGKAPETVWRAGNLRPGTSSPVVAGGRVYTINGAGVLSCGDARNGERAWQVRLKGPFSASPVIAGNLLYAPNEAGLLQVVDLSKPEGEVVSELNLGDTILATPSLANDALYLRSDKRLWKIGG